MIQHERHQKIKIMNKYQSKGLMYGILCLIMLLGKVSIACPPDCGSCYVWNGYECIYLGDLWCDDCEALNASCTGCDDICPEGYMCVGDYCKQECEDDSDCDATRCMACSNGDYCTYQCQSGEDCINSTCVPESTCNPGCASGYSCANGVCVDDDGGICNPACGEGYTCVSGTCVPVMTCNPACGEDETCVNGNCTPSCSTSCNSSNCEYCDASIGGCVGCPEGYSCDWGECKQLCLDDSDCGDCETCTYYLCEYICGDNQICQDGQCITQCQSDSDCGECESCSEAGECIYECEESQECVKDACMDSCEENSDCPEGEQCSQTGVCQPEDGGGSCEVQGDCLEDQSCINGVCVEDGTGCDPVCSENETCINGTCVPNEGGDECDPICAIGYVCINGACVPDNDNTCDPACEEDEICVNGACAPRVDDGCESDDGCPYEYICYNGDCIIPETCVPECADDEVCVEGECEPECDEEEVYAATLGLTGANPRCITCYKDPSTNWTITLKSDEMNRDWLLIYPNNGPGVAARKSFYATTTAPSGGTWEWTFVNSSEEDGGRIEIVTGGNKDQVKIRGLHSSKTWGDISLTVRYWLNGQCISASTPITVRKICRSEFYGNDKVLNDQYGVDYARVYIHYFLDQFGRPIWQEGILCEEDNECIEDTTLINPVETGTGKTKKYYKSQYTFLPEPGIIGVMDVVGFNNPLVAGDSTWRQILTAGGWVVDPNFLIEYKLDLPDIGNITKTKE